MEQQPLSAIESVENTDATSDCSSSSLVKHMETACSLSDCDNQNSSIQIEMFTDGLPVEAKQLELMDINDDCLSAIFRKLSVLDMVSFADVCKRFRSIAQRDFGVTKPIVDIAEDVSDPLEDTCPTEVMDATVLKRASRLFQIFGSSMTGLQVESLDSKSFDKNIVALMVKYCSGGKLTTLNLHLFRTKDLPISLKQIFKNLRILDLRLSNDATIPDWLDAIEDLMLDHCNLLQCNEVLKRSYEKLQRISLYRATIDSHDLDMFLNKNKTIKDIWLLIIVDANNHTFDLPTQIENLRLSVGADSDYHCIRTGSFGKLENLKSLALDLYAASPADFNFVATIVSEIVAANIPLQHLILNDIRLDMSSGCRELCKSLSKLIHLDKFTLGCLRCEDVEVLKQMSPKLHRVSRLFMLDEAFLDVNEIISIVLRFSNLKQLIVSNTLAYQTDKFVVFDSKSFEKIVSIVQNRNNGTRLDIALEESRYKFDIPTELAHQFRHILSVQGEGGLFFDSEDPWEKEIK